MKIFKDRQETGQLLADKLKDAKANLILGIPRGGVVVAKVVAQSLKLPLDIIVTRKIGAPGQEELALGALDPDGNIVWDSQLLKQLKYQISNIKYQIEEAKKEIKRREAIYRQGKEKLDIKNKTVILTDDGMATGATVLSAVKYLKRHSARVILAVPVASGEALERVKDQVDECVVLEIPEYFQAVSQFYDEFPPVSDEEVIQLLNERR